MFSLQTAVLDTDDGGVIVRKHTSTLGTSKIHHFGFNIKKCNFGDQDIFTKNVIAILISICLLPMHGQTSHPRRLKLCFVVLTFDVSV